MNKIILFLTLLLLPYIGFAKEDIDKQINSNKKNLEENKKLNRQTQVKIDNLSKEINTQSKELNKIDNKIEMLNKIIASQEVKLNQTQNRLGELEKEAVSIQSKKEKIEEDLIAIIIDNFSWTFAVNLASKKSFQEIINSELYKVLSENTKEEINDLNQKYQTINVSKLENENEIKELKEFIKVENNRKKVLSLLQKRQQNTIKSLKGKHLAYQKELKTVVQKQKSLSQLLGKLNILKQEEAKKEKELQKKLALEKKKREKELESKKATTQQKLANNIDIEVRMLGSSVSGIKILKYKGAKTIPPLKSYTITKKFGKYFDPVYKIQLFNESIVLKSKTKEAKVFNVLDGKIVYAKNDSAMLENVVIIQHKNGLHTIYSHLDKISPTIKVGKWIKKGYVVGRVDDSLTFQATKNSAHINPQDLFN